MKTISKKLAVLGLFGAGLLFVGCAQNPTPASWSTPTTSPRAAA